jgi:hypothetical protein
MKYLKKFNENSHDWASNFMPGASDEEIMRARFGDRDLHAKIQEHPAYHDARLANPHASDEEIAAMIGHYAIEPEKSPGYELQDFISHISANASTEEPEGECEPCDDDEEGAEGHAQEPEVEGAEEMPNVGSRIKNFFGFGKK